MQKQVSPNTHMIVGDSVACLKRLVESWPLDRSLGLCYLDSFDLDWKNPEPAAQHGFDEWLAVEPLLTTGSLLLIDDTPADLSWVPVTARQPALAYRKETGLWPGKGNRVVQQIVNSGQAQLLYHGYSALFQF